MADSSIPEQLTGVMPSFLQNTFCQSQSYSQVATQRHISQPTREHNLSHNNSCRFSYQQLQLLFLDNLHFHHFWPIYIRRYSERDIVRHPTSPISDFYFRLRMTPRSIASAVPGVYIVAIVTIVDAANRNIRSTVVGLLSSQFNPNHNYWCHTRYMGKHFKLVTTLSTVNCTGKAPSSIYRPIVL